MRGFAGFDDAHAGVYESVASDIESHAGRVIDDPVGVLPTKDALLRLDAVPVEVHADPPDAEIEGDVVQHRVRGDVDVQPHVRRQRDQRVLPRVLVAYEEALRACRLRSCPGS